MNYCTFPQRPPWGQEESGRGERRGKIGKKEKRKKGNERKSNINELHCRSHCKRIKRAVNAFIQI